MRCVTAICVGTVRSTVRRFLPERRTRAPGVDGGGASVGRLYRHFTSASAASFRRHRNISSTTKRSSTSVISPHHDDLGIPMGIRHRSQNSQI
eukprot:7346512-Prymnesium_polylepis.1